jgi:quercetin dioxygenase-like cupin family protein
MNPARLASGPLCVALLALALAVPVAAEPTKDGAATAAAAPFVVVPLPAAAGEGPAKESKVLADTAHQKTVVITLRKGTVLPTHASGHAAIIQSLAGRGVVRIGDREVELSPTSMVLLEPRLQHEVVPHKGGDLVILVHHLKTGTGKK